MKSFFLSAKPWQIVILICAAFLGANIALLISNPKGNLTLTSALAQEAYMAPVILCFMGWAWSVGSFLHSILRASQRTDLRVFRLAVIFSALYLLTALLLFSFATPQVIVPLHLLAMLSVLYIGYFDAMSLRLAEAGEPAAFKDYVVDILLILSMIGIGLIQSRINRLYTRAEV
jgi:hypothetical protein